MANKKIHRVTATIFDKRGKIIAVGQNSIVKTHPVQAMYAKKAGAPEKQFLHAEIAALIKCRGRAHKIMIERYDTTGNPKLAKPCPICELAIKETGIKFVEYTVG